MKENKHNVRESSCHKAEIKRHVATSKQLNHHLGYFFFFFFSQIHAAHHNKDAKHISGERRPSSPSSVHCT